MSWGAPRTEERALGPHFLTAGRSTRLSRTPRPLSHLGRRRELAGWVSCRDGKEKQEELNSGQQDPWWACTPETLSSRPQTTGTAMTGP